MKKSVIIIIILIYISSIVFINFFGMKILSYNEVVYAQSIECINPDMVMHSDGTHKYVILTYSKELTYTIQHKIYPENVTNNKASYIYDQENTIMSIDSNGIVRFNEPTRRITDFTIILRTTDGTNKETTIKISLRKP